jgi:molybdopterin biosynthesis enzyme MoaB
MTSLDETRAFIPLKIAVLTISDTRKLADDRSGDILVGRLGNAGHKLAERAISSCSACRDVVTSTQVVAGIFLQSKG